MFSERLKSERKAKKWTQQQLADKLHITPEYLQENNFDKIIFITN